MSSTDLTQDSVPRSLFRLTAPMVIGVSSNIVVAMLEIAFIGQLGTQQLAAITFTFPLVMMLNSVALGIGIGTSSVIARGIGSGARDDARRLATHSLVLVAAVTAILALVGWLAIDHVFTALGATPEVIAHIHRYLDVYYPGVVFMTLTMVASNVMRANGSANVPGTVMTFGAALNLMLDPILIFGWLGLPRLELAGAATAMLVTRIATAAVLVWCVYRGKMILRRDLLRGLVGSCRRILHVGLPAMATQLIGPVSSAIVTRLLAGDGEAVIAGYGVATRMESVAVMLLFALSGSIGPYVGQNWGANRPDRVSEGLAVTYRFSLAWGVVAAIPMILFGDVMARWIDPVGPVVETAAFYLAVVPWSYGLWGVLMMTSASFNALGKPLPSMVLSFARMGLVYIPLALLLDHLLGYKGIFMATAFSNCVMGVAGYLWFRNAFEAHAR
jgi:putative MATE family efflux protein